MQDLPNGGRRSKHWPPGAGDPRYATALSNTYKVIIEAVITMITMVGSIIE